MKSSTQLPLKPVPMTLFPTMDSLGEVIDLAMSKQLTYNKNELLSLLMTYHNTLLKTLKEQDTTN
jgi:hypothetical protein